MTHGPNFPDPTTALFTPHVSPAALLGLQNNTLYQRLGARSDAREFANTMGRLRFFVGKMEGRKEPFGSLVRYYVV